MKSPRRNQKFNAADMGGAALSRTATRRRASLELSAIAGGFADTPKSPRNLRDREIASAKSPKRTLDGRETHRSILRFMRDVEKKKERGGEREREKRRNLLRSFRGDVCKSSFGRFAIKRLALSVLFCRNRTARN